MFYKCRGEACQIVSEVSGDHCGQPMEVDTLPGRRIYITHKAFQDAGYEETHGFVQAPSPDWKNKYILAMDDGKTRYLYRSGFEVINE